jgi:hypothetical protein
MQDNNMNSKLDGLYENIVGNKKENIIDDTVAYIYIKKAFNVPNLTPYDYALLKMIIAQFLKNKNYLK